MSNEGDVLIRKVGSQISNERRKKKQIRKKINVGSLIIGVKSTNVSALLSQSKFRVFITKIFRITILNKCFFAGQSHKSRWRNNSCKHRQLQPQRWTHQAKKAAQATESHCVNKILAADVSSTKSLRAVSQNRQLLFSIHDDYCGLDW